MYSEYWNLTKPPFDNVPDASMYVDCHESMENVIAETIYAIKEGNECLTVIVGEVGLGKTLSLRVIIDSLEPEKYKVALITNPALSFVQLLREIIGQISGKQCEVKNKVDLQEMFNRLLFQTADQGKKIVIVIDEANVLSPSNLDDLRLLTNMQDDERNLFTLLLVGQMEFAKTLEHPKRANLFQRIGTYGHLEKLPSEEAVKNYIDARLRLAGTERTIFSDDAIPVIWEFSEHGIPRLINKICKLCLKAGETNEFETISAEVAVQIADRFQKLSKTSLPKRQPQSVISPDASEKEAKTPKTAMPKRETHQVKVPEAPISLSVEQTESLNPRMLSPEEPPKNQLPPQIEESAVFRPKKFTQVSSQQKEVLPQMEEPIPPRTRPVMAEESSIIRPVNQKEELTPLIRPEMMKPEETLASASLSQIEKPEPMKPKMLTPEAIPESPVPPQTKEPMPFKPRNVPLTKPTGAFVPIQQNASIARTFDDVLPSSGQERHVEEAHDEQLSHQQQEDYEDVFIGKQTIKLAIPAHIIRQAQITSPENKNKLAGYWSAQILKGNPNIMHASMSDPVGLWFEVKNIILKKFNSKSNTSSVATS